MIIDKVLKVNKSNRFYSPLNFGNMKLSYYEKEWLHSFIYLSILFISIANIQVGKFYIVYEDRDAVMSTLEIMKRKVVRKCVIIC